MSQYSGEGLDIHPILQGQRGKGMAQAMEASVLQSCIFEELLMEMIDGIRAIHLPRHWRWEHIGITRMQTVLLDQQVHCLLRNDDSSNGVACLGRRYLQHTIPPGNRFCDRNAVLLNVKVTPK